MTKLTQSMVLEASRAACVALTDEDLAVMVLSLNRQLGQQAAAPGVEQLREVLKAAREALVFYYAVSQMGYRRDNGARAHAATDIIDAALAGAPPPSRLTMDDVRNAMSNIAYAHMSMEDMSTLAQDIANNLNFRAVAPPPVGTDDEFEERRLLNVQAAQDKARQHSNWQTSAFSTDEEEPYLSPQQYLLLADEIDRLRALSTPPVRPEK